MKICLRGAAAWLPLLVVAVALAACGGGGNGGGSSSGGSGSGGAGSPPPPPPPATPPPSGLSYSSPQPYTVGTAITPLDPTVTGTVTSYGVTPALPAGLSLDTTTGRISGTPTAPWRGTHTITATNAGGNTTFALTIAVVGERSTTDRKPDEKSGNQVHVMYVLPSDAAAGDDLQLDQTGTLEASLNIANEWFKTQTGGKGIRFDTYDSGKLDVTFLKIGRTDAQMNVAGSSVRLQLEEQLILHGFNDPNKSYLVYYGGNGDGCGRGAWPPNLPGNVGALYIGPTKTACTTEPFATGTQPPAFLEFLAVHETLHTFGFAADCAPHHSETGHISDSVNDIMFSGGTWKPTTLDVNHDDYYTAGIPGCRDLMNSAFLDPLPAGAEAPPAWPYVTLTDLQCFPNEQSMPRDPPGAATQITFANGATRNGNPAVVGIYESVPNPVPGGNPYSRLHRTDVTYDDGVVWKTTANTVFVVTVNGGCAYLVKASETPSRFLVK